MSLRILSSCVMKCRALIIDRVTITVPYHQTHHYSIFYVQEDHPDTQHNIAKHQQWDKHVICQCATIKRYTELIQHTEICTCMS